MKDRFRFRVWNRRDKKMIYNAEDVYDGFLSGFCENENNNNDGWISCFGEYLGKEEYIIMQCTGLKDKNGNLIYEGDVIRELNITGRDEMYENEVKWCNAGFDLTADADFSLEVLGNIYENPELLKE